MESRNVTSEHGSASDWSKSRRSSFFDDRKYRWRAGQRVNRKDTVRTHARMHACMNGVVVGKTGARVCMNSWQRWESVRKQGKTSKRWRSELHAGGVWEAKSARATYRKCAKWQNARFMRRMPTIFPYIGASVTHRLVEVIEGDVLSNVAMFTEIMIVSVWGY